MKCKEKALQRKPMIRLNFKVYVLTVQNSNFRVEDNIHLTDALDSLS